MRAAGAGALLAVDERHSGLREVREHAVYIGRLERQVVQPRATRCDEARDGALVLARVARGAVPHTAD